MLDLTQLCGCAATQGDDGGSRYWRMRIVDGWIVSATGPQYLYLTPYSVEFMLSELGTNLSDNQANAFSNAGTYNGLPPGYVFDGAAILSGDQPTFHKLCSGSGVNTICFPTASQYVGIYYAYDFGAPRSIHAAKIAADFFMGSESGKTPSFTVAIDKSDNGSDWVEVKRREIFRADLSTLWAASVDYGDIFSCTITW